MAKPALPGFAPVAKTEIRRPYLGASVIVKTSEKIGGQSEHAAVITRVHSDVLVNVMVFPAEGQAYPIASINLNAGAPCWRWPIRT